MRPQSWRSAFLTALIVAVALMGALVNVAAAAEIPDDADAKAAMLKRASTSMVGVQAIALEGAKSIATLGESRRGSGVVIGPDGLVLTIGYLILEAEQVQLLLDKDRIVPARIVAYDVATGFGLLQALAPLRVEPARLASVGPKEEPLMVASGGPGGSVTVAQLASRRRFAGYWEYLVDGALFTTPPRPDHNGAGLFNTRGELVGIGSLIVADAAGEDAGRVAGNMFVPADLLPPILAELRARGRSDASRRAWLGLNCIEYDGRVHVLKVSDGGPAESAGVLMGDRIVSIDGKPVEKLDALWTSLWSGGQAEREVTLEVERSNGHKTLKLQSVDRMSTLARAKGI